jgi:hypothetical protein
MYICTNAGTGSAESMSDWLEYTNLDREGKYARWRIQNGHEEPYAVKYYSIGNENYGSHEIGAKERYEWARLVTESAKMMKYEIGWCGQNASLAVSFLYHAQMHGDEEARRIGYAVLDSWLEKARSPQGLLLTRYDPPDMPIDAVNLGGAGLQFFEAFRIARLLGDDKPAYREAALEICDFAIKRQRLDGGIGVRWDQVGKALQLQGTAGAYLILPLAEAFLETEKEQYKITAVRAFTYYYNEFHRGGYGTAGALDTSCIDKESVIPLLKGALLLHRATGFTRYLQWAEEAAWYLSTWQWHHTVAYAQDTVHHRMGYDTFGGTAVSLNAMRCSAYLE